MSFFHHISTPVSTAMPQQLGCDTERDTFVICVRVLKYIRNKAAYQFTVRDLLSHVEKASLVTMGFIPLFKIKS